MQVVYDLTALHRGLPTVLTIGAFDGVHRGHQFLIRQVVQRARQLGCASMVVTFDPRPVVVLRPGSLQLADAEAKRRVIGALGVDVLAVLPFTHELASLSAGQFLVSLLDHVNLLEVWTGADFAFGHKREGDVAFLVRAGQNSGFDVHVVARQQLGDTPLSSTAVRTLLEGGKVEDAAELLGHYAGFAGPVVTGFGRGKDLGFPTANVQPPQFQQLPATGIYAGYVRLDGRRLPAAISVGYNPVFDGKEIVVEAYILDFDEDLRQRTVALDFVARIREEKNFDSVEDLIGEIHRDVTQVREVLARSEEPGELLLPD